MSFAESKPATTSDQAGTMAAPAMPPARADEKATGKGSGDDGVDPTKKKRRSLFGLGKKKGDKEETSGRSTSTTKEGESTFMTSPKSLSRDTSKLSSITHSTSPSQSQGGGDYPHFMLPGSSPRLASPAGSQIFERDVQESAAALPTSPAIPSHITTEDHIPSVLDASSEAITDDHLDPDSVEIVTHNVHQPAAVTVTGASPSSPHPPPGSYEAMAASWAEEMGLSQDHHSAAGASGHYSPGAARDDASNYGALDASDVRRLSFISFADVVQGEHAAAGVGSPGGMAGGSRESMHLAGLTSLPSSGMANRSPSPMRSPVSSQGGGPGTSPPTSKSGSVKGVEMSPARKPLGSPGSGHHGLGASDVNIETMSQALRRTGSADLSHARSHPTSPIEGGSTRQL